MKFLIALIGSIVTFSELFLTIENSSDSSIVKSKYAQIMQEIKETTEIINPIQYVKLISVSYKWKILSLIKFTLLSNLGVI